MVELGGKPMLDWSLEALSVSRLVGEVVVAVPAGQVDELSGGEHSVVAGGKSRSESVAAALESIDAEVVVVHDAARPLVTEELVDAVLDDLLNDPEAGAVVAAAPVTDTIKQVARGMEVDRTLDRSSLWAAQTPQAFRADALREALASTELLAQATDDAMLVERLGGRVLLHQAPAENVKVTTPLDLRVAELLLADR
jgi:2-C-methyl-D-erythritol 4-phosphate cytidylyltransferase